MQNKSQRYFNEAEDVLVGGVNSPVRAYKSVGGTPIFIKSGKGAYITSVDNQRYLDYVLSYGPLVLGHAHPEIIETLVQTIQNGTTFGAPTELETRCAKKIKQFYPYIDKVRFVNSGTEASMSAIRLARGVTKKRIIVKFRGCYHGHVDALLVESGSGAATLGVPDSEGVLDSVVKNTAVLDYNNAQQVKAFFQEHGKNIACIMVEPVAGNMGVIVPELEFIQMCRECCHQTGALLIFDEVMCGFRSQWGGTHEWIGVEPDIVVLGKVIGGGLPCGAYAGKKEIMGYISPEGPVYQAGTLSGNPCAMAAGLKTMTLLEDKTVYQRIAQYTEQLVQEIRKMTKKKRMNVTINQKGSMFTIFFTGHQVREVTDVKACNSALFSQMFHGLLTKGILFPPSQYEACFTSSKHTHQQIDETLVALDKIFK